MPLPWTGNHSPLPSNEPGSLRRLGNLKWKLKRMGMEEAFSGIIEEQKAEGVVEGADQQPRQPSFTFHINRSSEKKRHQQNYG